MTGYSYFLTVASITLLLGGCFDEHVSNEYVPLWTNNNCAKEIVAVDGYDHETKLVVLTPKAVCFVDAQTGMLVKRLSHQLQFVRDIACGTDKCWIGGGSHLTGTFATLDINAANRQLTEINIEIAEINSIAVSSNKKVVTAHGDESLVLYDWEGTMLAKVFIREGYENYAVIFFDGQIIAGNDAGELIAWDGKSKTVQRRMNLDKGGIFSLTVKRGKLFVLGGDYLSVINASNWLERKDFNLEKIPKKVAVETCDMQDNANISWCGLSNGSVARINLDNSNTNLFKLYRDTVRFIQVNGSILYTASEDGFLNAWKILDKGLVAK